jgi:hypothetical protein
MDPTRFDALVRSLGTVASRRRTVAHLLTGLVAPLFLGLAAEADGKNGKGKRKNDGKDRGRARQGKGRGKNRKDRIRSEQLPANCCSSGDCAPGKGKNLAKCCYDGQDFAGANFEGSNLGSANFAGANASNASFGGANLGKACLVDAILTGATINNSTNLGGVIFCRTVMPDDSVNNSGCNQATRCCQTCIEEGEGCGPNIGGACCDGLSCINGQCAEPPTTTSTTTTSTTTSTPSTTTSTTSTTTTTTGPCPPGQIDCGAGCVVGNCCTADTCPSCECIVPLCCDNVCACGECCTNTECPLPFVELCQTVVVNGETCNICN